MGVHCAACRTVGLVIHLNRWAYAAHTPYVMYHVFKAFFLYGLWEKKSNVAWVVITYIYFRLTFPTKYYKCKILLCCSIDRLLMIKNKFYEIYGAYTFNNLNGNMNNEFALKMWKFEKWMIEKGFFFINYRYLYRTFFLISI